MASTFSTGFECKYEKYALLGFWSNSEPFALRELEVRESNIFLTLGFSQSSAGTRLFISEKVICSVYTDIRVI